MKKIILTSFVIVLLILPSCSGTTTSADSLAQPPVSLSGQVYGWTIPPLDTSFCEQVLPANPYFSKLLFLNDSAFIKIIPTTCGVLGDCIYYYSGNYEIDQEALILSFDKNRVVHHLKSKNLLSPFVEVEASDLFKERLARSSCKSKLFFEECNAQRQLMAPKSDTLEKEIRILKHETIWNKLTGKN